MSEAKHALKTLFELAGEKKVTGATQMLELQHENSEVSFTYIIRNIKIVFVVLLLVL